MLSYSPDEGSEIKLNTHGKNNFQVNKLRRVSLAPRFGFVLSVDLISLLPGYIAKRGQIWPNLCW